MRYHNSSDTISGKLNELSELFDLALRCQFLGLSDRVAHLAAKLEVESRVGPLLDAGQGLSVRRHVWHLSVAHWLLNDP